MKRVALAVALFVPFVVTDAAAAEVRQGLYVGIELKDVSLETAGTSGDPENCLPFPCNLEFDGSGWGFFLGYRFNKWFAVEGAWNNFDDNLRVSTDNREVKVQTEGADIVAMGMVPVGFVDFYGQVGFLWWDGRFNQALTGPPPPVFVSSTNKTGSNVVLGLGVLFNIKRFGIRAEWMRYEFEKDSHYGVAALGLQYRWGPK